MRGRSSRPLNLFPAWLTAWMADQGLPQFGAADLQNFATPRDLAGEGFPRALAFLVPMSPRIMAAIKIGPTQAYADEYDRVNRRINETAAALTAQLARRGFRAMALAASERTDPANLRGDFPHKTAATRAGLGWIGRHCQLVTNRFGPWVRLGTVFTDLEMPCGPPVIRHFCGRCTRCVEACPAGALSGAAWEPGLPRGIILDAGACDRYKKEHFLHLHQGHNCGICAAACPFGLKLLKAD
jgi:epoxyqueuosine reductase